MNPSSGSAWALVGAVLALCACSTTALYFYTLMPPPAAAEAPRADWFVEVLPVSVPAQVDIPQLVVRQGPGEVAVVETRLWAAPLGDEIRNAVSFELGRRLGVSDRYRVAVPEGAESYRVKIDVRRFDSSLDQAATLAAAWSVSSNQGGEPLACEAGFQIPVSPGYPALVAGHQRALAQLSERIAASVTSLRAGAPDCG